MERLGRDIGYAIRSLVRRPGTASLAIATLGLGIATSTAMFSAVDVLLIRSLPFPEPDRLVSVYPTTPAMRGHPTLGGVAVRGTFSWPEFVDLRDNRAGALESIAILSGGGGIVRSPDGGAERVSLGRTGAALFPEVLRVDLQRGRSFTPEEEAAAAQVLILSDELWERRYDRASDVIGSMLEIGSSSFEIIGVLPSGFELHGWEVDGWIPFRPDENRGNHSYYAIGRLPERISLEEATERLRASFVAALPADHNAHGLNLFPRQEDETRYVRGPLTLLTVASAVLLLVACGNVAVLLLGAAIDREQEIAIRGALGAGRGSLARQLLAESLVIAVAGAILGLILTRAAIATFALLAPPGVARIGEATVDLRVLGFALGMTLLCGALAGLVPALVFSRTDPARVITGARGATSAGRARLQGFVVVSELALATVLVVGAGLLGRTVMALNAVETGFDVDRLVQVRLSFPSSIGDGIEEDVALRAAYFDAYDQVGAAVERIPGVEGTAYTSVLPLQPDRNNNDISPEGWDGERIIAERRFVSAGFFETMGTRIVEGRPFRPADNREDAASTMIISEGIAHMIWPDESAVGKRISYWGRPPSTVIGVAENVRDEGVRRGTDLAFYVPRKEAGQVSGNMIVRVEGDVDAVVGQVRSAATTVIPGIAVWDVAPLSHSFAAEIASERYRARLVVVFSGLATLFALMGVYGVTARSVAARTREMGIRLALGAERGQVMRLVLQQALRLALFGTALGVAAALMATRAIESFLWGVEPTDALVLATTAALLGCAALLAALAPGRRAARADPIEALRAE